MRTNYTATLIAAALGAATLVATSPALAADAAPASAVATTSGDVSAEALRDRVRQLLDRYAANDQPGVIALLDPDRFVFIGSGMNETTDSVEELRALMDSDFKLWGSARFTDLRELDVRSDGQLGTVFFLMTFTPQGGSPLPVRAATTWRNVKGAWMLTQSASWVPEQPR